MPTDAAATVAAPKARALDDPRARRILRFTIGVTLATAYCTYVNWPFSFLLPALVIPFLALPISSAPSLPYGLWITTKLIAFAGLGTLLMLPLHSYQLFGFAVVALILFVNFYLQAEGKITNLNAMIVIVGITLVPAFGESSMDVGVEFAKGMSQCALAMFPVLWIAFAVVPGGVFPRLPNAPRIEGTPADRAILALRPVLVLLPLFSYMLSSDNNIRYLIGYYQPAMIAQHAKRTTARKLTLDLILATLIGATGGLLMWWRSSCGHHAYDSSGDGPVLGLLRHAHLPARVPPRYAELFPMKPATTTLVSSCRTPWRKGFTGDDANMKFYERIVDYAIVTSYSVIAVLLFDAVVDRACGRWAGDWRVARR